MLPVDQRLAILGAIVFGYAIAEMVFGFGMSSVTLVADGFHNLADAGGFGIAILANYAQKANAKNEAKAERIGLIGGFTNCSVTMILTFCAGVEAFSRLSVPHAAEQVHIGPMYFVCAVGGICINFFGALFLGGHGHSHGGVPCKQHGSPAPSTLEDGGVESSKLLQDPRPYNPGHGHGHGHRYPAPAFCVLCLQLIHAHTNMNSFADSHLAVTSIVTRTGTVMAAKHARDTGGFKKPTGTAMR
jgi:Co/Zn/Cd efflux system component